MQELTRLRDAQEQLAAWQQEEKFAEEFSVQLQASLNEVLHSSLDGHHGLLAALRADQEAFQAHAAAMAVWSSDVARVMGRLTRCGTRCPNQPSHPYPNPDPTPITSTPTSP